MAPSIRHLTARALWALVERQHGVISRTQLLALGFGHEAIRHRVAKGRLQLVHRGVYAVGRPGLSRNGRWMAAVLACGRGAVLSHQTAAQLWGIVDQLHGAGGPRPPVHVSVPGKGARNRGGIAVHRRACLGPEDCAVHEGIPVTTATTTLVDLAGVLSESHLIRAINEADRLDLIDPEALRAALQDQPRRPGLGRLRRTIDRDSFRLTDSELERRFLALVRLAGLPLPETQAQLNGFRVDFYWPALGLVVETDGLRYHRTPAQQTADHRRDQAHAAAGLDRLRFSHAQVHHEPRYVVGVLVGVARRLSAQEPHGD